MKVVGLSTSVSADLLQPDQSLVNVLSDHLTSNENDSHEEAGNDLVSLDEVEGDDSDHRSDWVCETCHGIYKTEKILNRHKQKHIGVKFTCNLCEKRFARRDSLKLHIKKKHP